MDYNPNLGWIQKVSALAWHGDQTAKEGIPAMAIGGIAVAGWGEQRLPRDTWEKLLSHHDWRLESKADETSAIPLLPFGFNPQ